MVAAECNLAKSGDRTESERIGLFGGSFDPIHSGHLLIAMAAVEEMRLDKVYFIPAAQSPFKPRDLMASPQQRVRLLRLALAGKSHYEVDCQEVDRGGVSYAIETVSNYVRRFAGAELFFLLGADHLELLPKWRDAHDLAALIEFVVVPRPGLAVQSTPTGFRIHRLKGFSAAISSSEIRGRVQAGLPIDALVPREIAEAVREDGLYL
jgi:nicotinate-nucleotide adenylyltransferase